MKVLNFGSLNIDYVYSVDHFVSAGETLSSDKMEQFCGGKGLNQSIALAKAGAPVFHAGCVGEADGDSLLAMLKDSGVDTRYIRKVAGSSGHAIIQVETRGQNCILLYGGANQQITREYVDAVLENFEKDDVLLLQNEINQLDYLVKQAFDKGMHIALNPSPFNGKITGLPLERVRYFLLNEVEGYQMTGMQKPEDILDEFRRRYPDCVVVLTLGKAGSVYDDGQTRLYHGIYNVSVVDTTAAGDTFTGYFLAGMMNRLDPQTALEKASLASSLAVSVKGAATSIPTADQVNTATLQLVNNR